MAAAPSPGVKAPPLGTILPWALQTASFVILLLVLVSPAPLSISDISLLTVAPAAVNQTVVASNTSSSSLIFGTPSSSSVSLSLSTSTSSRPVTTSSVSSASSNSAVTLPTSSVAPATNTAPATASSSVSVAPAVSSAAAQTLRRRTSRQLMVRENLNQTTGGITVNGTVSASSSASSQVRLVFGPLGSCGTPPSGQRICTSARLSPQYNSSVLATEESGSFSTVGLLERLPTTPILLLVDVVVLLVSVALGVPSILSVVSPRKFGSLLEAGPTERNLRSAQHWAHLATLAGWVLLAAAGISMRITCASARTAFNAANASRTLPLSALRDGAAEALTLEAQLGNAFGLMWAVLGLLAAAAWLERKRLRRADAVAQARADVEAQWGRGTLQAAMENLKGGTERAASSTLAAVPPAQNPAQGHYWLPQEPGTAAYLYPPGKALAPAHPQFGSASPFWLNQAEKFGASTNVPDIKRSVSPASAYEHHMRASSDIDAHSLAGSASLTRHDGIPAGETLARGLSPAPEYWTLEGVERVRDEAKEARNRAELDRVAREQRADEGRELERWEMARRRKAGGLGYH